MLTPIKKDIQIYLQVAYKEFVSVNNRYPSTKEEWEAIVSQAKNIWKFSEIAFDEIEKSLKPKPKDPFACVS